MGKPRFHHPQNRNPRRSTPPATGNPTYWNRRIVASTLSRICDWNHQPVRLCGLTLHIFVALRRLNAMTVGRIVHGMSLTTPQLSPTVSRRRVSKSDPGKSMPAKGFVTFEVSAPMLRPDWHLAICGEAQQLGGWDTSKAVAMSDARYPVWSANVKAEGLGEGSLYKFLIIDSKGEVVAWGKRRQPHARCHSRRQHRHCICRNASDQSPRIVAWRRYCNPCFSRCALKKTSV